MTFSSISPRYGSRARAVAPLDKEALLTRGEWIDGTQATHFLISDDERSAAWLTGKPLECAQEWHVDHNDKLASQLVYRRYALAVHAQGWSGFPEDRKDRKPVGMVVHEVARSGPYKNRRKTRFYQVLPSERRDVLAPREQILVEMDNAGAYNTNLALVMGAASLHTRALDLDILDPVLAEQVYQLALEHLGPTPFVRVGRAPKLLLVYRVSDEDADIPTKSYAFLGADGEVELTEDGKVLNAIEFLGQGRNFTSFGVHHKTGKSFDWSRGTLHPAIAGPDQAPLVTKRQLNAFYTAVNKLRPLSDYRLPGDSSSPTGDSEVSKFEHQAGVWFPQHTRGTWVIDGQGCVVDGRESYMSAMTWNMISANFDMLRDSRSRENLRMEIERFLTSRCAEDDKRNHEAIRKEARLKWTSKLKQWMKSIEEHDRSGKWLAPAIPFRLLADGTRPFAQHAPTSPRPTDGSMDWLPEQASVFAELSETSKIKGLIKADQTKEQIAANKKARALIAELADREAIHGRVADEIDYAVEVFLATLDQPGMPPMHILRAPTGAGKTTRFIARLGAWLRDHPRQPGQGPVMVLLPSHDNINEAMAVAERTGMIVPNPSDMDERTIIAELDAIGVKAIVFSGKRHHCHRLDDLNALSAAGVGTGGLCGAEVEEGGDAALARMKRKKKEEVTTEKVLCPFRARGECGYWKQQADVATADVIFLPHSYLTMHKLPEVLKNARAVVVDESVVYRLLHQTTMPLDTLTKERGTPFVTKAEKKANPKRSAKDLGEDMEQKRHALADVVIQAFMAGECPAEAVVDAGIGDMIPDAIRVVTRSHSVEREVNPLMTSTDIAAFANRPKGLLLYEEEKFWRLLQDRIADMAALRARGDSDARWHLFYIDEWTKDAKGKAVKVQVPHLRLSWRSEMNWSESPKLLLDASASPEIMEKCSGAEVTVHTVEAPLHVRTIAMIERPWANRAFRPPDSAEQSEKDSAQATIRKARALITKTAVSYAHGRVLVGTTITVRQVLSQGGWVPPPNVDFVHFGALRGKDGFKHHLAAISIGRSEQPIGVIDGYRAALTYDDDVPEKPFDALGTGLDASGKVLFRKGEPRTIPFRSGHDLGHLVPQMPGKWARILEEQWRDEELRQFLGRLRPVYRGGAPVEGVSDEVPLWICMSSTLPENIVVDELFALDDMIADTEFHDLMRLSKGVLADGLTALLPNCKASLAGKTMEDWTEEVLPKEVPFRKRLLASMHRVRARIDGIEQTVQVAAWHEDPVAAIMAVVAKVNTRRFSPVVVEILSTRPSANARVTASLPRKPDQVDNEFAEMSAPFGDPMLLGDVLEMRERDLRAAHAKIAGAGRTMSLEELEQKWRDGTDLETMVERAVNRAPMKPWVRVSAVVLRSLETA